MSSERTHRGLAELGQLGAEIAAMSGINMHIVLFSLAADLASRGKYRAPNEKQGEAMQKIAQHINNICMTKAGFEDFKTIE